MKGTIKAAIRVLFESLPRDVLDQWIEHRNGVLRDRVLAFVHDYARHRGVILEDKDIVDELEILLDEMKGHR